MPHLEIAMTKGMLDPQIKEFLREMAQQGITPLSTLTAKQAREMKNPVFINLGGPPEPVEKIENRTIPGLAGEIPIRIYHPQGSGPFPILVYFHGGGWVICNLDTHDSLCSSLANGASCIVVSVDYRLAPEYKFPAAVDDAYAATRWASENTETFNGDPNRIAVGGDSAGGNLAAVVSFMARDNGSPALRYQLLIYPVTDLSSFDTRSYREHGEEYILTKDSMEYYRGHYIKSEADALDPYASPLLAQDLSGLPPALVITAEFDVLTDESKAFANRLRQAGISVTYSCYEGMIHPFLSLAGVVDRARDGVSEATTALKSAFGK
jgi:acetyl esterase